MSHSIIIYILFISLLNRAGKWNKHFLPSHTESEDGIVYAGTPVFCHSNFFDSVSGLFVFYKTLKLYVGDYKRKSEQDLLETYGFYLN